MRARHRGRFSAINGAIATNDADALDAKAKELAELGKGSDSIVLGSLARSAGELSKAHSAAAAAPDDDDDDDDAQGRRASVVPPNPSPLGSLRRWTAPTPTSRRC